MFLSRSASLPECACFNAVVGVRESGQDVSRCIRHLGEDFEVNVVESIARSVVAGIVVIVGW